jgi:hypothetical protein
VPDGAGVTIAWDDRLLRRVLHTTNFLEWHPDFNRWVPSLAAIRFDPDGMSVFMRRLLDGRGYGADSVTTLGGISNKRAVVYQFDAQAATDVGYSYEHIPNEDSPIGYAHALVRKPVGLSRQEERIARTELATRMLLVHGTIDLPRPDGV